MDIKCPRCTEPWDMDCLHDAGAQVHKSFDFMRKLFTRYGCAAIEEADNGVITEEATCEQTDKGRTLGVLMELAGDDIDGYAADVEDFEYAGLL
jgi:hypothetical protein